MTLSSRQQWEIVINMIVHRDYMHHGDSSIKIYNNRIEFFNPGSLPGSISIDQLEKGNYISEARNKKVAAIFKEAGEIEKYGSGIQRIIKGFASHGLKTPMFENFQHGFRVTVFAAIAEEGLEDWVPDKVPDGLTDNQQKILHLIAQNNEISMSQIAVGVGISKRKVLDNINKLKEKGLLKRIGPAKGGYWEVIGS